MTEKRTKSMELVHVSPDVAAEWLGNNYYKQRSIKKIRVRTYAEDMKRGIWQTTMSEPIVISDKGYVLDGQHRLNAVIYSGVSIDMWVLRGVPESEYDHIDQGAARSAADMIGCTTREAALAKLAAATIYGNGSINQIINGLSNGSKITRTNISRELIRKVFDDDQLKISQFSDYGSVIHHQTMTGAQSHMAYALWLEWWFGTASLDDVDNFVNACKDIPPVSSVYSAIESTKNAHIDGKKRSSTWLIGIWLNALDHFIKKDNVKSVDKNNKAIKKYDQLLIEKRESLRGMQND